MVISCTIITTPRPTQSYWCTIRNHHNAPNGCKLSCKNKPRISNGLESFNHVKQYKDEFHCNEIDTIIATKSNSNRNTTQGIQVDPKLMFEDIESICNRLFSDMSKKITEFTEIPVSQTRVEFPELVEFKRLKGRKVYPTKESAEFVDELFTAIAHEDVEKIASLAEKQTFRYLVYSTYAKGYISQISTTYGDFYESVI